MKILISEKQADRIFNNKIECEKCEHSWKKESGDSHPYLCHDCGWDQKKGLYDKENLFKFWKNKLSKKEIDEKWSEKYKKSIDCNNPKGFSQKAHCQGKKKVETNEATDSSSSGSYETTAAWSKSMSKKDWRGASKPQIPGGKFVQVKKKCKKFPYCNQGDINALKIFENEVVKKAINNISKTQNISENVIKNILIYEYEKSQMNK